MKLNSTQRQINIYFVFLWSISYFVISLRRCVQYIKLCILKQGCFTCFPIFVYFTFHNSIWSSVIWLEEPIRKLSVLLPSTGFFLKDVNVILWIKQKLRTMQHYANTLYHRIFVFLVLFRYWMMNLKFLLSRCGACWFMKLKQRNWAWWSSGY